jgi:hypothetical protein
LGIAKDMKRAMEHETENAVPWWMGLSTIQRAAAMRDEIEAELASFKAENRAFAAAFARLGFAGHVGKVRAK